MKEFSLLISLLMFVGCASAPQKKEESAVSLEGVKKAIHANCLKMKQKNDLRATYALDHRRLTQYIHGSVLDLYKRLKNVEAKNVLLELHQAYLENQIERLKEKHKRKKRKRRRR